VIAAATMLASAVLAAIDLTSIADESTVELTTVGRRSGQPRTATIWFVVDGDRVYVQSGGGGKTDWYRNLTANPAVTLKFAALALRGRARPITDGAETARIHARFESKYLRARVLGWFGGETGRGKVVAIEQLEPQNQINTSSNQ
jgi:deazaflavin-dependent oxidoreductase (nitroreductase family)